MFMKFAVDPEALGDMDRASFESMSRNWWIPHGILVDSEGTSSVLNQGRAYREFATANHNFHVYGWPLCATTDNIDWQNMSTPADLAQYEGTFSLALLGETRAQAFGVPDGIDGEYSKTSGGVEAIRFRHVDLAEKLNEAKVLSQQMIRGGMPLEDLWQERFSLLSRHSKLMNARIPQVGIPVLQCYSESHQILMSAEHDNLGIKISFSGGENYNSTAH